MIQMLGQLALSVMLLAWGYTVMRVPRRPIWLWPGIGAAILLGFLALTSLYVVEGASAGVKQVAASVAAVLYVLVVAICAALFVTVSRAATHPTEGVPHRTARSLWGPKDDDRQRVIVDDWAPDEVIDAGTAPKRAEPADPGPEARFEAPAPVPDSATPVYRPAAPAPALHAADAESADDDEQWESIKPRRAMSPESGDDRLDAW